MIDNEKIEILNQIRKLADEFKKISIIFDDKENSLTLTVQDVKNYTKICNQVSKTIQELEEKLK